MKKVIMSFEVEVSKYKKNIISLSKINYEKIFLKLKEFTLYV